MNRSKLNLKTIAFSLGLAAGMMLPASASAQGVFGDMLDNYYSEKEQSSQSGGALLRGSNRDQYGSSLNGTLGGATQEDPTNAPLGSGIAVLVAAGAGYALLKRKEEAK
jgi:hypothetical protein